MIKVVCKHKRNELISKFKMIVAILIKRISPKLLKHIIFKNSEKQWNLKEEVNQRRHDRIGGEIKSKQLYNPKMVRRPRHS